MASVGSKPLAVVLSMRRPGSSDRMPANDPVAVLVDVEEVLDLTILSANSQSDDRSRSKHAGRSEIAGDRTEQASQGLVIEAAGQPQPVALGERDPASHLGGLRITTGVGAE